VGVRIDASSLTSDEEDEDILAPRPAKRSTKQSRLPRDEALTKAINNEILETSLTELRNLKRVVRAGISPKTMNARKRILETISELVRLRREIVGIEDGSVVFRVMCPTLEALNDLWEICNGGKLRRLFVDTYVKEEHRGNVTINVSVNETEWQQCRQQLLPPGEHLHNHTNVFHGIQMMPYLWRDCLLHCSELSSVVIVSGSLLCRRWGNGPFLNTERYSTRLTLLVQIVFKSN